MKIQPLNNEFSCLIWSIFSLILCYKSIHWCRGVLQHVNFCKTLILLAFILNFFPLLCSEFCFLLHLCATQFRLNVLDFVLHKQMFMVVPHECHHSFPILNQFFPQNNLRIMLMQDSLVAHQGWCAPFFKTPALVESYNKLGASPDKQPEKKK